MRGRYDVKETGPYVLSAKIGALFQFATNRLLDNISYHAFVGIQTHNYNYHCIAPSSTVNIKKEIFRNFTNFLEFQKIQGKLKI